VNLNTNQQSIHKQGKITVLFTALVLLLLKVIYPEPNVLSWDVFGYYLYLPAKFIYHDPYLLNQDWLNQIVSQYESTATLYQINQHPETGNWIIKYSMGMSFLYAPFFFIAHWLAPIFNCKQDGFSAIYRLTIESGMFLFSLIGLYYLLNILYTFFESKIAIISFVLIVFATNYLQLSVQYSLLTHVPIFTLYAILIFYTIQWDKNKQWKYFFIMAFSCGLIALIRPNEIICILIPLLWNVNNKSYFIEKIKWFFTSFVKLGFSVILFSIPILIQMWYWKKGTHHWLYYSYQNPGEGFDFLAPYTKQFLFSFRKGWFVYTPLAFIAILSLAKVYRKNKNIFLAILIPTALSIYIVSSWSCWWYAGGSYSQRAILSIYPLLGISLGYGLQYLISKIKLLTLLVFALILCLNVFQAWQFKYDVLDHERMTFEYYKKIFLKTEKPKDAEKYMLIGRSADENEPLIDAQNYQEKLMVSYSYKTAPSGKEYVHCKTFGKEDSLSLIMNETNEFVDGINQQYFQITTKDHFWIKTSVDIFIPENFGGESPRIVTLFNHGENGTYKYRNKYLLNNELKINQWNHIESFYLSPEVRSTKDNFSVYLWHPTKEKVFVDNFNIAVLIPNH
jgi:hypothetical protein